MITHKGDAQHRKANLEGEFSLTLLVRLEVEILRKVKAPLGWPAVDFRLMDLFLPRITNINHRWQNKATGFATAASRNAAHQRDPISVNRLLTVLLGEQGRQGCLEIMRVMKEVVWF